MFKLKKSRYPSFLYSSPWTSIQENINHYDLTNKSYWETDNKRTVKYGTETIRHMGPKTWDLVPDIKESTSLLQFKKKIKKWKPNGCTCRLCRAYIYNLGFL